MNKYNSMEELYFSWYLDELRFMNLIDGYDYEPEIIVLTNPVKIGKKTLLREFTYTYDFKIYWSKENIEICKKCGLAIDISDYGKYPSIFIMSNFISKIEIKADFSANNMERLVKQVIKFVYYLHNDYINLIKMPTLFKDSFTPNRYLLTDKTTTKRKIKFQVRNLKQYIDK